MKELTMKDHIWIIAIGSLLWWPIFMASNNIWVTSGFLILSTLFYRIVGWVEGANRKFFWESKDESTDSEYRF